MIDNDDKAQLERDTYRPTDTNLIRRSIQQKSLNALEKSFPMEWGGVRMELKNLKYDNPHKIYSLQQQDDALMKNNFLSNPIKGDVYLYDSKTNELLDSVKGKVLQHVPYYTERGTFIYNGSEYSTLKQYRLRPGIYSRRKTNGLLESQFNVERGTGTGYRVSLEPSTGMYKLNVGQSSVNLYSLLHDLGVEDDELQNSWGEYILNKNRSKYDPKALKNIYNKLVPTKQRSAEPTREDMIATLKSTFNNQQFDASILKRNLNYVKTANITEPYTKTSAGIDAVVRATKKLIDINKGIVEPDERDSFIYKTIMNTDDLIAERTTLDAGKIRNSLMFKLSKVRNLKHLPSGLFDSYGLGHIVGNPLSLPSEETNPLFLRDQQNRLTVFGAGGIGSTDAVTEEAQNVHPSQFGFIDVIASPESEKIGVDLRLAYNTRIHKHTGKLLTQIKDNKTGKIYWATPEEVYDNVIAFPT